MIKRFLVPSAGDQNSFVVIEASFTPPNAILEAPKDPLTGEFERAEWLVIQEQTDAQGNVTKIAVVDKALKKQIRDQQKAARDLEKQERDQERAVQLELREYFRNFDKTSLASIDEIQDAIDSIVKALKLINKSLKE